MRARGLAVLPLALIALAWTTSRVADQAFHGFIRYDPPFGLPAAKASTPAAPLSDRVVLVLVDGLGVEPSRRLPFLQELRARGADLECRIGLPSLSLPARAVMLTGAWHDVHGQATNYAPRPLKVDHVFASARRSGLPTLLAAGDGTHTLLRGHVSATEVYPKAPETAPFETFRADVPEHAARIRRLLAREPRGLAFVEFHVVDEAGHGWGAASDEYARAAALVDEEVRGLAGTLDLTRETLVVTADHGHVPEGGHGGPEDPVMSVPLVLAGRGVRAGVRGTCAQSDVAPTVAALLGIAFPASNQGHPLLDALALDEGGRRRVLAEAVRQREAFVGRYVDIVRTLDGTEAAAPAVTPGGADGPDARLRALAAAEAEAKQQRLALESALRARSSVLVALLPAAVLGVLVAGGLVALRDVGRALPFAGLALAFYFLLLPVLGLRYSLTAVNKDEWVDAFFGKDMALAVGACAVAAAAQAWRRRGAGPLEHARASWLLAALFCHGLVLKIALAYWRHGVFVRWQIPDQWWAFGMYLDLLAVTAAGFAAPLLPLVALLVARLRGPAPA